MPKVDVIIPAYNAARYLPAAIESVEAQTYENWCITLVDDGSRDNTAELIKPYLQRLGPRMQYVYQENRGLPAARNAAIRHSNGEILALLDADDLWLPHRLAVSVEALQQRPEVGLVYGFNARIDAEGRVFDVFKQASKHPDGWVAPYIYMRTMDLPCPTVSFRRACVQEVGLFDESLRASEDRDLWLRIALRYQVALIPELMAHYRVSPQAMTTDPERMLQAQLRFIEKHAAAPGLGWRERRAAMSGIYRQRAEAFALRGERRTALRSALKAWSFKPDSFQNARTTASLLAQFIRPRSSMSAAG